MKHRTKGLMMASFTPGLPEELAGHREAIRRYILGIVRDSTEAEDLTQEALLRAQDKLGTLQNPSKMLPWLYRIATNVTYDRFRQAPFKNRPVSLDQPLDGEGEAGLVETVVDTEPRLDLAMEQEEMSDCVQRYMAGLSDQYRAVILLHDTQGLTNPQIAEMLGVSLPTVKIRLHRARKRLRGALGDACSFSSDDRGVLVCEPKPEEEES
ncbi:RNA polymerase sigma factor [Gemmatimonadota bacterium]